MRSLTNLQGLGDLGGLSLVNCRARFISLELCVIQNKFQNVNNKIQINLKQQYSKHQTVL